MSNSFSPAPVGVFHTTIGAAMVNNAERAIRANGQRAPEPPPEPVTYATALKDAVVEHCGNFNHPQFVADIARKTGTSWLDAHCRVQADRANPVRMRDLDQSLSPEERRLLVLRREHQARPMNRASLTAKLMAQGMGLAAADAAATEIPHRRASMRRSIPAKDIILDALTRLFVEGRRQHAHVDDVFRAVQARVDEDGYPEHRCPDGELLDFFWGEQNRTWSLGQSLQHPGWPFVRLTAGGEARLIARVQRAAELEKKRRRAAAEKAERDQAAKTEDARE